MTRLRIALVTAIAGAVAVLGARLHQQHNIVQAQNTLASAPVTPRAFYGRRLEPKEPVILHGAGQSDEASFEAYSAAVFPAKPMLMMRYVDLRADIPAFFAQLRTDLAKHQDFLIPQIGLSLNYDNAKTHYEAAVASGADDARLVQLCAGLQSLERPVFLRIGYEFNGPWNGYEPASYVAAFRRIATAVRTCTQQTVALVWDWSPEDVGAARWSKYYPGDDFVDWWAFNPFLAESMTNESTQAFLAEADARKFPVMIAESSPRGHLMSEGQRAVDAWFAPYFGLLRSSRGIKAFCYIDWDWRIYPQWSDWGDGRIEKNRTVLNFYRSQVVSNKLFAGATDRAATLKLLRVNAAKK